MSQPVQLTKRIKVLVCDDHALFREGVKSILNSQPDIEVVGEAKQDRGADASECAPGIKS